MMKRKIWLILIIALLLVGCATDKEGKKEKADHDEELTAEEPSKDKRDVPNPQEAKEQDDENRDGSKSSGESPSNKGEKGADTSSEEGKTGFAGETGQKDVRNLDKQYFNVIENINGEQIIKNPDNILVLVNKKYALPSNYIPADLVRPNVEFYFGSQQLEQAYMRKEAARALEEMFAAARSEGIRLLGVSGYRSYARQEVLYQREVETVGREKASQSVSIPGHSEHQTGLSMDISAPSMAGNYLSEDFEIKPEGKWLKENAHRFGFILRYPKDKEQITGYMYEPWHFRFVGKDIAATIYKNNWTLEEFFENVRQKS